MNAMYRLMRRAGAAAVLCSLLSVTLCAPPAAAGVCGDGNLASNEECDPGGAKYCGGDPAFGQCDNGGDCNHTGFDCYYANTCCKHNCQYVGIPELPCSDGNVCTNGDMCNQRGECVSGPEPECGGIGADCVRVSCDPSGEEGNCDLISPADEGSPCSDGLACTVGESCIEGICTGGVAPDCTALADQCNTAACDPSGSDGNCTRSPVTDGTSCDDGNACNVAESCIAGQCAGGAPPDCAAQGGDCEIAACDTNGPEGNCNDRRAVNEGGTCEDGDLCTSGEVCRDTQCLPGTSIDCSLLDDACGVGTCDPGNGICSHLTVVESPQCGTCGDGLDNDNDGDLDTEDTECSTLALFQRFAVVGTRTGSTRPRRGGSVRLGRGGRILPLPSNPPVESLPFPLGNSKAGACGGSVRVGWSYDIGGSLAVREELLFEGPAFIGKDLVTTGGNVTIKRDDTQRQFVGPPVFCSDEETLCDNGCAEDEWCEIPREILDPLNDATINPEGHVDLTGTAPDLVKCEAAIAAADDIRTFITGLPVDETWGRFRVRRAESGSFTAVIPPVSQHVVLAESFAVGPGVRLVLQGDPDTTLVLRVTGKFSVNRGGEIVLDGLRPEHVLFSIENRNDRRGGKAGLSFGSRLEGTVFAPQRNIRVGRGARVFGATIGYRVLVRFEAEVEHVPFISLVQPQ